MTKNAVIAVLAIALAATLIAWRNDAEARDAKLREAVAMWDEHADRLRECLVRLGER